MQNYNCIWSFQISVNNDEMEIDIATTLKHLSILKCCYDTFLENIILTFLVTCSSVPLKKNQLYIASYVFSSN